jgi:hypothetical protein
MQHIVVFRKSATGHCRPCASKNRLSLQHSMLLSIKVRNE